MVVLTLLKIENELNYAYHLSTNFISSLMFFITDKKMASTALNTEIDVADSNNGRTGDWSVYNCVFCNSLLDGNSIILKCLHIACENCLTTRKTDSGLFYLYYLLHYN